MGGGKEIIVGCVGKPSAGKSTFFSACCSKAAKIGSYPFTTIEPNTGITYWRTECACLSRGKVGECTPRYGRCENGTRFIPIKLLDVAGLVPGASDGLGLGNKFLDDLRGAHCLIHVLDVSGTTNEKGEATQGYDPVKDHEWLLSEIQQWIFGNLWGKWSSIVRRHVSTKSTASATLGAQFTGYSCKPSLINKVLEKLGLQEPVDLSAWQEHDVRRLCEAFVCERFPMILLLNKIDHPDSAANIQRVVEGRDPTRCLAASSMAECFLKQCTQKKWISYNPGSGTFWTKADAEDEAEFMKMRGEQVPEDIALALKTLVSIPEPKVVKRLERIKDLVLYRYGSTGVWDAVQKAVELMNPVVCYPVRNLRSFATVEGAGQNAAPRAVFADAVVMEQGSTVLDLARKIGTWLETCMAYAEAEDGRRIAEDATLEGLQVIVRFAVSPAKQQQLLQQRSKSGGGGGNNSGSGASQSSSSTSDLQK